MRTFLLAILLGLSTGTAFAQSTSTIQGAITDSNGGVLPGVTVTVRNAATGLERAVPTDSDGQYLAAALPPGRYRVEAALTGFQTQTQDVDVDVARTLQV